MTVLSVRQLELRRGQHDQAFSVSLPALHLEPGEILAITGPSGCGKSTLIEALGLILTPTNLQQFSLLETDITDLIMSANSSNDRLLARLRGQHYGYVPQTHGLLPYLTVTQNLTVQARINQQNVNSDWINTLSDRLGLRSLSSLLPRELSIGQRQRVSFLRALSHKPAILLADEPTSALDPANARELFNLMLNLVRELKIAMIVVTHEWGLVESLGLKTLTAQSVSSSHVEFSAWQN